MSDSHVEAVRNLAYSNDVNLRSCITTDISNRLAGDRGCDRCSSDERSNAIQSRFVDSRSALLGGLSVDGHAMEFTGGDHLLRHTGYVRIGNDLRSEPMVFKRGTCPIRPVGRARVVRFLYVTWRSASVTRGIP